MNAALARLAEIRANLAYAGNSQIVERALFELGEILGATASRPEKETGRGPDVLWIFDSLALCIEAKNEKFAPIYKSDAEQLLLTHEWCEAHIESLGRAAIVPVFATDAVEVDRPEDISFGPRLLSESIVLKIVERLKGVLTSLSYDGPIFNDTGRIDRALTTMRIRDEETVAMFLSHTAHSQFEREGPSARRMSFRARAC